MNRSSYLTSTRRAATVACSTFLALGLSLSAALAQQTSANQPVKDLVPFKGIQTLVELHVSAVVPLDPPVMGHAGGVFKGESDLFGPYTHSEHFVTYLGVDGRPMFRIGEAVWSGINGDSLTFGPHIIMFMPSTKPDVVALQGAAIIRSGRGRFLGATGSVTIRGERNLKTNAVTVEIEGLVTRPR